MTLVAAPASDSPWGLGFDHRSVFWKLWVSKFSNTNDRFNNTKRPKHVLAEQPNRI